jgi:protein-disulfide isomerase
MRLISMNRIVVAAAALLLSIPAFAQGTNFKDTSMLRAPAGVPVAIYEFEDLECPACARAFPITRAAAEKYKIPMMHHDFPLKMHIWSFDAAVIARYIQDKISPQAAEEYRRAVFANQTAIASKDDLNAFTQKYFQSHGRAMPFVVDPTGRFAAEVNADYTLGERVGLTQTPTIFIVTQKGYQQVSDVTQLYAMLDTAIAENPGVGPAKVRTTAHK